LETNRSEMEDWKFKPNVKHRLRRSQRRMGFILVKLLNFVQPNFERTPPRKPRSPPPVLIRQKRYNIINRKFLLFTKTLTPNGDQSNIL
ncbi:MAG: hypothetical protein IJF84_11975, partial [Thermoguttaceae bacterium]|nr:hypothetical protein [Thermoguttaceae bacterium]